MTKIALSLIYLTSALCFAGNDDKLIAKVRKLAKETIAKDLKSEVTRIEEGICGGEGPSYLVEYKVRKWVRTDHIKFSEKWETIKTYGISESEVAKEASPVMMDSETCVE